MKPQNLILFLLLSLIIACEPTTKTTESPKAEKPTQEKDAIEKTTNTPTSTPQATLEQDRTPNEYRNKNWRPEEGNYFFSEAWTWEFYNALLPANDPKHKGTFTVYLDPPTGTMLLAEHLDEMTDWIIVHPDGRYTTAFTDVHGKPHIVKQKMKDFDDHDFKLSMQQADFEKHFTKLEGQKEFGENTYGWQTIKATPYKMTFERTDDVSNLHILAMPFSVRGLYLVSQTNGDLNFPFNLNFGYLLPENYLVVSEDYEFGGKRLGFHLKSVTPSEYFANTTTYVLDH